MEQELSRLQGLELHVFLSPRAALLLVARRWAEIGLPVGAELQKRNFKTDAAGDIAAVCFLDEESVNHPGEQVICLVVNLRGAVDKTLCPLQFATPLNGR